jgi:hypothetical protein
VYDCCGPVSSTHVTSQVKRAIESTAILEGVAEAGGASCMKSSSIKDGNSMGCDGGDGDDASTCFGNYIYITEPGS